MTASDLTSDRLATFFDSAPDAILIVDEDGGVVQANERVFDLFGYDPAELEGEKIERLVPRADREDHPSLRPEYMENPESRPMGAGLDLRARRKDGSTFPVDISLSPIERSGQREVIAVVRDVSEQEKLRRKYRTLVEIAPDAVFLADADTGEITEVNQQAAELLGTSKDDLVGRDQTDLHPAGDTERYRELFRRHVDEKQGTADRFQNGDDLYVETDDGERVPVEISVRVTRLAEREVIVGLFRDVSKRRAYERDLHRQIDRLEALAHVLSHDLRNPLNVAMGGVTTARRTGDVDHLDRVERAHDRIEEMVEDVLTMVRDGYDVEAVEPIDLGSLVDECWQHVETADAELQVAEEGIVYADSRRIRNLFENLFRNAVEHAGHDVTVEVGVSEEGFYVADDGPGIPPENREDLFEPGWTTGGDNTGLGMNIVSEIATAHGWEVAVGESETGGARFEFTGVRTARYRDSFADERGPDSPSENDPGT
jgi:PAS domain S-box-containing protein